MFDVSWFVVQFDLGGALMSALGGGLSGAAGESKHVYPTFLIPHSLNSGMVSNGTSSSYPHGALFFIHHY